MALSVLAYNLTRVMNIVGTKPLMAAIVAIEPLLASHRLPWEGWFYTAKTRPISRCLGLMRNRAFHINILTARSDRCTNA
jgi:hypothetical protein